MMTLMYNIRYAVIAGLVLISYLSVSFGFIKISGYSLSLSGIAAIVLSIGMAIDACILIFERYREERLKGKTSHISAVNESISKSWPAILDGNVSTGIIGILLYLIGMNIFKGF